MHIADSTAKAREIQHEASNLASNDEKVDVAGEVHWKQQCDKTMYYSNALVPWHEERSISIVPQTVISIHSSTTDTNSAIRFHHSMKHLSVCPTKIDYVFQMLQTQVGARLDSIAVHFVWHLIQSTSSASMTYKTSMNNVQISAGLKNWVMKYFAYLNYICEIHYQCIYILYFNRFMHLVFCLQIYNLSHSVCFWNTAPETKKIHSTDVGLFILTDISDDFPSVL